MADESKTAAPSTVPDDAIIFDLRGPRGALTAEEATRRCAPILVDGRTDYTGAILSTWAFDEASAVVVASALAKLPNLVHVDMSDIIAGREEAIGLRVYEVLTEVLKTKKLKTIDLSDNALGPKGVASCREMLEGQDDLERLYLCRNGVSAEALRTVADLLLFRKPTKLTHLHFFNNMCGDAGAKAAADVMRESPMLQDFRFSSCRAIEDGGKCMAEALSATTNLVRLEMSDGSFGEDAGVVLAKALATNPGVVHLDLSDIGLGDDGVVAVCDSIKAHCPNVEYLSFAASELTDDGAGAALASVLRRLPKLRTLRLEDNDELTNATMRKLARAIAKRPVPDTLQQVDLSGTGLTTAGLRALCAVADARPGFGSFKIDGCCASPELVRAQRDGLVVADMEELEDMYDEEATDDEGGDTEDEASDEEAGAKTDAADATVDELAAGIAAM